MCGISGIINHKNANQCIHSMIASQEVRGPDSKGIYNSVEKGIALGHNRLSIIDLSDDAKQPMMTKDGRFVMIYNGEIYNYIELREELKSFYTFHTKSDSEVLLFAYQQWGVTMLDKLNGMFAFAIYDTLEDKFFFARDRFGVKPFYYAQIGQTFLFGSEIKSIHSSGLIEREPNIDTWSMYFSKGMYDHSIHTFWHNVVQLPGGCYAEFDKGKLKIKRWYTIEEKVCEKDSRSETIVMDELLAFLESSVQYRFRSDVPVGICLSGGLDSSLLLALVNRVKGKDFPIHAFTFYTGDERYDELTCVKKMIEKSQIKHHSCLLSSSEVPQLAKFISSRMDEPFGGLPTLGMSKVFAHASKLGIKVLLDGNGMDEAWAGYEYYRRSESIDLNQGPIQGSSQSNKLNEILKSKVLSEMSNQTLLYNYHYDPLINVQLRDILIAKIPRAMRFADRNSMTYSLELREPFLDYRIVELGLRQPADRKIRKGEGKYLIRKLAKKLIPASISEAPKRALQTPQREWLSEDLKPWVESIFEERRVGLSQWFDYRDVKNLYEEYCKDKPDNSFYIWQVLNYCLIND